MQDPVDARSAIERVNHEFVAAFIRKDAAAIAAHEVGRYTVETPAATVAEAGLYIVLWHCEAGVWRMHRDIWNSR